MKKVLKYTILALFILNLPGFVIVNFGSGISSIMSYASFLLLIVYYFQFQRGKPNMWLVYAGLGYFLIAGLNIYVDIPIQKYVILIVKYMILVIFGNSFFKEVTKKEMINFITIGALSILINATLFSDIYGRYSGFYLNPNAAGYMCITGYALCYSLKKGRNRTILQIILTLAGLLTFSRTFILIWILTNIISMRIELKNVRVLVLGVIIGITLLTFGELFNLNGLRFKQYQAVFNNKASVQDLEKGGRSETWSLFYEETVKHPIFGGGYGKFQRHGIFKIGPHNTYLLILGEAGIIPLIIFIAFMTYLLFWSNKLFSLDPSLFLSVVILLLFLLTSHNYFDTYIKLCVTLFIYQKMENLKPLYLKDFFEKKILFSFYKRSRLG